MHEDNMVGHDFFLNILIHNYNFEKYHPSTNFISILIYYKLYSAFNIRSIHISYFKIIMKKAMYTCVYHQFFFS